MDKQNEACLIFASLALVLIPVSHQQLVDAARTVMLCGRHDKRYTYRPVIVLVLPSSNAVTNSNQYSHSDWPPDEEDQDAQQESLDDAYHKALQPGLQGDVWLKQFHSLC